jgi:hypothetical protein
MGGYVGYGEGLASFVYLPLSDVLGCMRFFTEWD